MERQVKSRVPSRKTSGAFAESVGAMDDIITFRPDIDPFPEPENLQNNILPAEWDRSDGVSVSAQLVECNCDGRYIQRVYNSKEAYISRLREAAVLTPFDSIVMKKMAATEYQSLMESTYYDDMLPAGRNPTTFVPIITGPFNRQLIPIELLKMKSQVYHAYKTNPLAKHIARTTADFVVGQGVSVYFKDPKAQEVWDRFSILNGLLTTAGGYGRKILTENKLWMWFVQKVVDGELFLECLPYGDTMIVRALDSATILEVVTDPLNIENVLYYHQQYQAQYQQYVTGDIPITQYVIRQIPADDVLMVRAGNGFDNEKRGLSEFYPILGWMKRINDIANSGAVRAYIQSCQTWDVTVEGDDKAVQKVARRIRTEPPIPGASFVHNKAVMRQAMGPALGGLAVEGDANAIYNLIAMGGGLPLAYLLSSMGANRAGVLVETEPSHKYFERQQKTNELIIHELKYRLFKYRRDVLNMPSVKDDCEVVSPTIVNVDANTYLTGIGTMTDRGYITRRRAAVMAARNSRIDNYNVEEEFADVKKEKIESKLEEAQLNQVLAAASENPPDEEEVPFDDETSMDEQVPSDEELNNAEKQIKQDATEDRNTSGGLGDGERTKLRRQLQREGR